MSKALSQSATTMAISPVGEESFDFSESAERAASRQVKGTTRERQMLNRQKLIASVCADFRSHFPETYGKTERLPSSQYEKIELAVDSLITKHLERVNNANVINFRRAFYHNHKDMEITERVIVTGENKLTLKEQLLGCTLFIGSAEKRLKDLEAKPTPDYDREKEVKAQIMKLNITKQFIQGELNRQQKLAEETQKPS